MKMNKKLKEYSREVYAVAKLQCDDDLDDLNYIAVSAALVTAMFPSFQSYDCNLAATGNIETSIVFYLRSEEVELRIELGMLNFLAQIFYKSYDLGIVYRENDLVDALVAVCEDFKANGVSELDENLIKRVVLPATSPFFTKKAYNNIKRALYV
ncbi:TPA: hypothetical protein NH480_002856 [Pseudomonas aeruginosa]|nr:hypothetical protein [Pseudomonas aeruginosa]